MSNSPDMVNEEDGVEEPASVCLQSVHLSAAPQWVPHFSMILGEVGILTFLTRERTGQGREADDAGSLQDFKQASGE